MEVYVFPLSQVLLYPSVSKPLHIFEPRYIQMVQDSLAQAIPIAIGFVDEPLKTFNYRPGEPLHFVRDVVGFGFPTIVEKKPDGSLLIFLHGVGKARLGRVVAKPSSYIVCEAEIIPEKLEMNPQSAQSFLKLQKVFVQWLQLHVPDPQVRAQFLSQIQTPQEVIGCYASYLLADQDMKQLLLEIDDINEKVSLIVGLISSGELVH
jgi:ATP-dependent Lon protease